ncbi:MAG: DUF5677 domain-containing protein [Actinomycetota bacterium]|nr:DUF5677 domain-containing protein [Actinomycetota bacterium]
MADPVLYRQIVDVLLAEHEASTPPSPQDETMARKLAVIWGLYCQVHRFARAAVLLVDSGMGQESIVLTRVMLEHTIVLHWIIERGDDGIDAVLANQSKQMKSWLQKTRNTSLEVPQAISEEITESFTGIDETKAASIFNDICRQVDCDDLYAVYGIQSQTVHPSATTSNTYIDPSGRLLLTPRLSHHANVTLVAHCLIWAERALDRLLPGPSRAEELEKLACAIQARPALPGYHPISTSRQGNAARRGRNRRKWKK